MGERGVSVEGSQERGKLWERGARGEGGEPGDRGAKGVGKREERIYDSVKYDQVSSIF